MRRDRLLCLGAVSVGSLGVGVVCCLLCSLRCGAFSSCFAIA